MNTTKKKTRKPATKKKNSTSQKKAIVKDVIKELKSGKDVSAIFSNNSFNGTYKGARKTKHNENWDIFEETADYELLHGDLQALRYRSRQLVKDNCIAEGTVIALQEMVVGDGPFFTAKRVGEDADKEIIQDIVEDWISGCDTSGERTINDICKDIISNCAENGDVLISLPIIETRRGIKTVVQLVEADRIITPSDMPADAPVRHGVQYNKKTGEVEGYWVRKIGISEDKYIYGGTHTASKKECMFMPKYKNGRMVTWLFKRPVATMRPDQSRSIPLFSTAIHILKQMEDLVDATVIGQRVAACIMGIIESNDMEGIVDSWTRDGETGDTLEDKHGKKYSKMQPGTFLPLRAGEKFHLADPARAGDETISMVQKLSRDLSMKIRIPYSILFLDLEKINFSSYRGGLLEARRMLKSWRRRLVLNFLIPVMRSVLMEASVRGLTEISVETGKDERLLRLGWPAWGYVDPIKEVKAEADAIKAGLTSHQRVCDEHGLDCFEVLDDLAEYELRKKELEEKHGIKLNILADNNAAQVAAPDKNEEEEEND